MRRTEEESPLSIEELILALEKLRKRLNSSGTERTVGLLNSLGVSCPYYWKSLSKFFIKDYDELKKHFLDIIELINIVEEEANE